MSADLDRRLDDVVQRGQVREQVEALEDHPDLLALAGDVALASSTSLPSCLAVADQVAVHEDPAALDLLEMVDAADERGLARAGRPDDDDDLAPRDRQRDPLEHLEPAERFLDVGRLDDDRRSTASARRRSRRGCRGRRPAISGRPLTARGSTSRPGPTGARAGQGRFSPRRARRAEPPLDPAPGSTPQIVVRSRYQTAPARKSSNGCERRRPLRSCRERRVQLLHAMIDEQRGRLEHVVELVAERRHDHPRRLRQDDPAHRLAVGHARATSPPPSDPNRSTWIPARTISRHVGALVERGATIPARTAPRSEMKPISAFAGKRSIPRRYGVPK